MWSSSPLLRSIGLLVALVSPLALAACSGFTPVYSNHGVTAAQVALIYDKPTNRLEQIIYQDLALRLGKSTDPNAPLVTIVTSSKARSLPTADVSPVSQKRRTVTANITLTDVDGKVLFSGARAVSADYTTDAQAFANQEAALDAANRAAKALADTIRLTILGNIGK